jgi:hypothetical protein
MHITTSLIEMGCFVKKTGSKVICNPPPSDSDTDYLVNCFNDKRLLVITHYLEKEGFESESESYEGHDNDFNSYRKGNINLIVTSDSEFSEKHCLATAVCRKLNLVNKDDRIMVFKAFLYNETPNEEIF